MVNIGKNFHKPVFKGEKGMIPCLPTIPHLIALIILLAVVCVLPWLLTTFSVVQSPEENNSTSVWMDLV